MRINYTTYDNRRDSDMINIDRHTSVMYLANDEDLDAHPYGYADVVGILHIEVEDIRPGSTNRRRQRVEVLWVRWYQLLDERPSGFAAKRMYELGVLSAKDPLSHGFMAPGDVLRAVHLVARYAGGRDESSESEDAEWDEKEQMWKSWYINM